MEAAWSLALNSMLLGFGLAMDAFSVSLADGLQEPDMPRGYSLGKKPERNWPGRPG